MACWTLPEERRASEAALTEGNLDFSGTYMAVANLEYVLKCDPGVARPVTVSTLHNVLCVPVHSGQRQAYFLYRKAAAGLAAILAECPDLQLADQARGTLKGVVRMAKGPPHRAAAEALGSVPARLEEGPPLAAAAPAPPIPTVGWAQIASRCGKAAAPPTWVGRSLVTELGDGRVLAVKFARSGDDSGSLRAEVEWMRRLSLEARGYPLRFEVPEPLQIEGSHVLQVVRLPDKIRVGRKIDVRRQAIAFTVHRDYFAYPNDHRPDHRLTLEAFHEVMSRNAWLLGKLTSRGWVHNAPIPLFHNRVQRHRRRDHGQYEWQRAGRLDRWLLSCRHPNMGLTGTRDFEHFDQFEGPSRRLYQRIGTHILSLLLVIGSYFRNRDAGRWGWDEGGRPIDARDLFDPAEMNRLVGRLFESYYAGFTGRLFQGRLLDDMERLVERMIEEMGVDCHMEEILRAVDQERMTENTFTRFLLARGFSPQAAAELTKGERDITTYTGPHLGGFNQRISLPEIIEFTAAAAACCIADRFWRQRRKRTEGFSTDR